MRLRSLDLQRAPGLPEALPHLEFEPGLNLLVGPNASGKSTLARVLRQLLWPGEERGGGRAEAVWEQGGELLTGALFDGRTSWEPRAPEGLGPGTVGLLRLGIKSLLLDQVGDREVGKALARELAGGLDLDAVAEAFGRKGALSSRSSEAQRRATARLAVRELGDRATELAAQERELEGLVARAKLAAGAGPRLQRLAQLAELLELLTRVELQRATLADFSDGLERLDGSEAERIDDLERQRDELAEQAERARRELAALDEREAAARFTGAAPDRAWLEGFRTALEQLEREGGELDRLDRRRAGLAAALATARAELLAAGVDAPGGSPGDLGPAGAALAPKALEQLSAAAARVVETEAEVRVARRAVAAVEARRAGLGEAPSLTESELGQRLGSLRHWLRLPRPDEVTHAGDGGLGQDAPAAPGAALTWLLLVLGLVGLAVGQVLEGEAPGLLVQVVGGGLVGAGAVLLWVRARRPRASAVPALPVDGGLRAGLEAELERQGGAPGSWSVGAVEQALREAEALLERERSRAALQDQLAEAAAEREQAEAAQTRAEGALAGLAEELGLAPGLTGLGLVRVAQLLQGLDQARRELATCEGELDQARTAWAAGLATANGRLGELGLEPAADAAGLRVQLERIRDRVVELETAGRRRGELSTDLAGHERGLAKLEQRLDATWEATGLTGTAGRDPIVLARRLEEHGLWSERRAELQELERELAGLRRRMGLGDPVGSGAGSDLAVLELPELEGRALTDLSLDEVSGWRDAYQRQADEQAELNQQIGAIEQDLANARAGSNMQDALDAEHAAEQALAAEREVAAEHVLGRLLLGRARASHAAVQRSPVLERAQAHFRRFTRAGWSLVLGDDGSYRAFDVTQKVERGLGELSDGTRAQLLLAARLAALQEREQLSGPLPLVLDEALSFTDHHRLPAIVEALVELSGEGRQVIYLTADRAEAAQWVALCREHGGGEPRVLDLERLRSQPGSWGADLPAVPTSADDVPSLAGRSPEQVIELLGVARPRGAQDLGGWHLHVLCPGDPAALEVCLRARLDHVGHWQEFRRGGQAPRGLDAEVVARLDARLALAEALVEQWRVGRGRPVEWDDVLESGAYSEGKGYSETFRELFEQHREDPRAFMDAVEGLQLRYSSTMKARLREHLEKVGCLDAVEPYAEQRLLPKALAAAPEAAEALGPEAAGAYLEWLLGMLRS